MISAKPVGRNHCEIGKIGRESKGRPAQWKILETLSELISGDLAIFVARRRKRRKKNALK